ncbi:GTPase [Nigerium massiliense]|uniref:GTPase n=1 Tax=Nigerium massiliense TaxID=1522317 RepID=UPI00058F2B4C|nr:GTPase [Nigerium massiliense]
MSETNLAGRLDALDEAAKLSRGRSPEGPVQDASDIVRRAGERLALSGDHTVIALAGATGSGKSSSFNALSGTTLATAGVTRPTTADAMAAVWGTELPTKLLDWLEVPRRHLIASGQGPYSNLVLVDLPDHDSTELRHRMTVDRMVKLVDMLIWIVDPQKYADGALHDGYLKPLADHAEVMVVVLNQADRLTPEQLRNTMVDLRRLLDSEGLKKTPLMAMSALTGQGVRELRELIERTVREKTATAKRFSADVSTGAEALARTLGDERVPEVSARTRRELNESTAKAAGVPIVVDGVRNAWRYRGTLATGWPVLKWLQRFRPDPLKRLGLPSRGARREQAQLEASTARTSLPKATPVQKAQLDGALRGLVEATTGGLPRGWAEAVRSAARSNDKTLPDELDSSIATADLHMGRGGGWWPLVNVVQWILFLAAVVGLLWLFLPLILTFLQFPPIPTVYWWNIPAPTLLLGIGVAGGILVALLSHSPPIPTVYWWNIPAPTLLLGIGVAGGILVALLSRLFIEIGARSKANRAGSVLTERIAAVTQSQVVQPVEVELERLKAARTAVARAR